MQSFKHKISHNITKLLTNQQFSANFDKNNRLERKNQVFSWIDKRDFRADVLSLLTSALRPRLLHAQRTQIGASQKREQIYNHFRPIFGTNRGKFSQNPAKIVVLSTILFGFSIFLVNFSTPVSATSITLTLPSNPLSISLSPVDKFKETNASSVSITTSDANWGYNFSIKAKDNNTLKNGDFILNSISKNYDAESFKNDAPANTWGFKPSKKDSTDNTSYLVGPTSSETLIEKTITNSSTTTDYTFSIATKIDSSIKYGNYSNNFILTVVANTASYIITYNLNGGDIGPSPQTGTTTEKSIALDSATPTKSGYEFLGWCSENPNDSEACSGDLFAAGTNYTLSSYNTDATLYATWRKSVELCRNGEGIKMKDGKCWGKSDASSPSVWANAASYCQNPWRLPSLSDFNNLVLAYYPSASAIQQGYSYDFDDDADQFTNEWGATSGDWWSSTSRDSSYAYHLRLDAPYWIHSYSNNPKTVSKRVRCVSEI